MEAYTGFAEVYDLFMQEAPYDSWENWLTASLEKYGIRDGLVLELGCGTGVMTERMAAAGYDMIGVDLSEDMLAEAMEKRSESGSSILYLQQDMREFELYGTVAAIYCICDTLNYITKQEELTQVFRLVNNYLDPGGLFLFDFNTPEAYQVPERLHPIVEEEEGITMIWENDYDDSEDLNRHSLTFFIPAAVETETVWDCDGPHDVRGPQEEGEPLYQRIREIHEQRAFRVEMIRKCLAEAGLIPLAFRDADDPGTVKEGTKRVLCMAKESGKTPDGEVSGGNKNV